MWRVAFVLVTLLALGGCKDKLRLASSTVKVIVGESHGSGVHLGRGKILTAAHVVKDRQDIKIKTDDGNQQDASVLWISDAEDVALLQADIRAASSHLTCGPVHVGDFVEASGNPAQLEFVRTWGKVSGETKVENRTLIVTDMTVLNGMSGGPVFDMLYRIVGLVNGIEVYPIGFGATLVPISFITPAPVICKLLART